MDIYRWHLLDADILQEIETKRNVLEKAYPNIASENIPDWNQHENLLDFLEKL